MNTDMTIQERYDDIAKRASLSEEIVRRVFRATLESAVDSMKKGNRVMIPMLCSFTPVIKETIGVNLELRHYTKVKTAVSPAMGNAMKSVEEFKEDSETDDNANDLLNFSDGVITPQINALT